MLYLYISLFGQRDDVVLRVTYCLFSLVGEWTAEWSIQGASKGDYQRYGQAQLDVYSRATFACAYWSYKCKDLHWSLKQMIENGYITL